MSLAARYWNCSAGELLDRGDLDMIERGYAYAVAKREADSMALQFFQERYAEKDAFGTITIMFLLSRLLANAN